MFRYLIAPFVIAVLLGVGAVALFARMAMEAPDAPSQPIAAAQDAPAAIKTTPEISAAADTGRSEQVAPSSIAPDAGATDPSGSTVAPAPAEVATLDVASSGQGPGVEGGPVAGAAASASGQESVSGGDAARRPVQAFANVAPGAPASPAPSAPNVSAPSGVTALASPNAGGLVPPSGGEAALGTSTGQAGAVQTGAVPGGAVPTAAAPSLSTPPNLGGGGASAQPGTTAAPSSPALSPLASAESALALAGNLAPALETPLGGAANPEQRDVAPDLRPVFDLVRVEPGGAAVLAGRASPNAMVSVTVDGDVVAEVRANRSGEFVALVETAPDPETRGLTLGLSSTTVDGMTLLSAAPVVVALPDVPGAPPVALRPTADGPELLQPTAPRADGGVSIDSVTYGDQGGVVVSGRGSPGQVARVYLDEDLHAETEVTPEGAWRADLVQEIKPEVYKLRVDQIDAEGGVSSRAETPFERAAVEDIVLNRGGVVVQPGNNLWRIASHVYGDGLKYHVIYARNTDQIRDPDLIYPGQIFKLPGAE